MRAKVSLIAALFSLAGTAPPLAAQSLADVAREEQERRKTIKAPSKVLTNKDLRTPPPVLAETPATAPAGDTATTTPATPTAPASGAAAAPAAAPGTEKPAEPAKDQAYWSGRVKALQTEITRNETFAVALQSRVNALANEYTNQGDGVQQQAIAAERQKTITELNRVQKQIQDDKKAFTDLQEEARRAGVPPGWLR